MCTPASAVKCPLHSSSPDTNQALRLCLGTKATGAEFGAVSALSINHDCSRLLCGFAKGQVSTQTLGDWVLIKVLWVETGHLRHQLVKEQQGFC